MAAAEETVQAMEETDSAEAQTTEVQPAEIVLETDTAPEETEAEAETSSAAEEPEKVEISKQDITNSKEIPGAKLTIFDKDGKEVESWVSEEKPHYIVKLPVGEYTLREVTAPDGYEVAEDVKFTVAETGEIQTVVMKDAPKKQPETTPKTGDDRNPLIWLMLLGIGGCVAGAAWYLRKKDEKDQNKD